MTTHDVAWAPGAAQYGDPVGWAPAARPGPDPAALLRIVSGGLAVTAGALLAGGTFPALAVIRRKAFDSESVTTGRLSGWGYSSEAESEGPGRELLLGIPLTLVAALLVVAGAVLLLSVRRAAHRPRALTWTVGAVSAVTAVFWMVTSYLSDAVAYYRQIDIEGWSVARSAGYWLVLVGFVLALFALAAVLVAALLDSPRRRARATTAPPAPYASGPYAAPGQGAPAPTAPPAWPPAGRPYAGPPTSPWGENR